MKRAAALLAGIAMILVALVLAATTNQNAPAQPTALAFATALHTTPSRTPTSSPTRAPRPTRSITSTPAPTVTPIPDWIKLLTVRYEIWIPREYPVESIEGTPFANTGGGESQSWRLLYGTDWQPSNFPKMVRSISLTRIIPDWPDQLTVYDIPDLHNVRLQPALAPIDLGRYYAYQATGETTVSGAQVKKLFFLIQVDDEYWVVVFSAFAPEYDGALPFFYRTIRSLTILPQR